MNACRPFPASIALLMLLVACQAAAQSVPSFPAGSYEPSFLLLRDTLYVLDTSFIEVRLDQQMIYQHFRSGHVKRYPCSTGDPTIDEGIATREGIFAIQWKSKKHMSQTFQVYLNYWMPFDGGIGFHGLQGTSYYRYLGRRKSSHGCVRISNETGARLFADAPRGTVVYVHSGSPARLLRFADSTLPGLTIMEKWIDEELMDARLKAVMSRRYDDSSLAPRLAIAPRDRFTERIDVGRAVPRKTTQRPIALKSISRGLAVPKPVLVPARLLSDAPEQALSDAARE